MPFAIGIRGPARSLAPRQLLFCALHDNSGTCKLPSIPGYHSVFCDREDTLSE